MGFQLDFTADTEETLEQGGRITEPGWYKATLKDTYEDDESGAQVLEFKIAGGAFDGSLLFERLHNPDLSDDDAKREMTTKRAKLIVGRLGIAPLGQAVEIDWTAAIGREYVLSLKRDSYVPKNGPNAGQRVESIKVNFDGVYPPTHDKIPDAVRKALGLPPAVSKGKAGGHVPAGAASGAATAARSTTPADIDVSNL